MVILFDQTLNILVIAPLSNEGFMNMYALWHVNYTQVKYNLHNISVSEDWRSWIRGFRNHNSVSSVR